MNLLNEYSKINEVAIRSPLSSFVNDEKLQMNGHHSDFMQNRI